MDRQTDMKDEMMIQKKDAEILTSLQHDNFAEQQDPISLNAVLLLMVKFCFSA